MTRRTLSRVSGPVRRTPRVPSTAGVASGFLSLLTKLASGSERLERSRKRHR